MQEAARKDIERAFGVLQSRFAIVRGPAHFWDKKTLKNIMTCCVILHNMILEDERAMNLKFFYDNMGNRVKPVRDPNRIRAFLQTYKEIENADTHQLQEDLQGFSKCRLKMTNKKCPVFQKVLQGFSEMCIQYYRHVCIVKNKFPYHSKNCQVFKIYCVSDVF